MKGDLGIGGEMREFAWWRDVNCWGEIVAPGAEWQMPMTVSPMPLVLFECDLTVHHDEGESLFPSFDLSRPLQVPQPVASGEGVQWTSKVTS